MHRWDKNMNQLITNMKGNFIQTFNHMLQQILINLLLKPCKLFLFFNKSYDLYEYGIKFESKNERQQYILQKAKA